MIFPFLLLALGLGAFAAYKFSPTVHTWTDDHVRAIEDAIVAHRVADLHVDAAHATADPVEASTQLAAAKTANEVASSRTVDASKTSQTPDQHTTTAASATAVMDRQQRIAALKQSIIVQQIVAITHSGGQCDVRKYWADAVKKDALLAKLHAAGMDVHGDNPWDVDTKLGVKLRAVWDPVGQWLYLIVVAGGNVVTCGPIWSRIDGAMQELGPG